MKNRILTIVSALALLALAIQAFSFVQRDSTFTKWMDGNEYQESFNQKSKESYPLIVEAKSSLTGNILFRAYYVPFPQYPSEAFWFYSNHGISTDNFENRHKTLKADGYFLAYHQAFEPPKGETIHQATGIKSKK